MSDSKKPRVGEFAWTDLTVENAEQLRDFYSQVVGWKTSPQSMGNYDDYNMMAPESGDTVAGVCHARGSNANIPAQWLVYITVESVNESIKTCIELGGKVIDGPRSMGEDRLCVIQDPAGAVAGLIGD